MTLGQNVSTGEEVDAVMARGARAGARIVKPAQDTFWGSSMKRRGRRVAMITGAGRGIGRATAEAFAAAGFAVVVAERAAASGRRAARSIEAGGAPALFVRTDVAKPGSAERAVRATLRRFGRLDCLVNNAGVLTIERLDRLTRRSIEEMVRVNLLGGLLTARAALPVFRRRRRGAIVNVASGLGKEGIGLYVPYCATKFGVMGLTEALADELRGAGIRVWAVCPGLVDTPMGHKTGPTESERRHMIPPERVARAIVELATGRRRRPSGGSIDVT
jgi:NAD(P)-dependent dehydrogenase (short-subunit alcohol dehydrogenase family)